MSLSLLRILSSSTDAAPQGKHAALSMDADGGPNEVGAASAGYRGERKSIWEEGMGRRYSLPYLGLRGGHRRRLFVVDVRT